MNRNKNMLIIFAVMVVAQIAVPVSMITKREATLRNGKVFYFRTEPVDPYDAFRGKYVALRIKGQRVAVESGSRYYRNETVYALVTTDDEGFAQISGISKECPAAGDYFKTKIRFGYNPVHIKIPFDRYYMDENLAPRAEKEYQKHSRRGKSDAYVAVRIKSGFAVLAELFIEDKPIREFLNQK